MMRITVHGAVYTALGALLLISGLFRGELLSTVCGGILILYAGFAAVAVAVTAFCWRKEEPKADIGGSCFTVSPCAASADKPFPRCAAGTAAFHIFEFSAAPHPTAETVLTVSVPLQKRKTVFYAEALPRGRYFYKQPSLLFRDFAGFFTVRLMRPPFTFRVYTVLQPMQPSQNKALPDLRSHTAQTAPSQERTAELYESRPYFPGDDPRKIHWKLYAHTGNLSIKLGAFEPPPVKRLTLYIEEPILVKKRNRTALVSVFDAFIGRLFFLILQLLESGIQCSLLLNDYGYPQGIAAEHPPRKSLRRYDLPAEYSADPEQLRNLLAVPALCFVPEDIPDAAAVFKAVPHGSSLLYCSVPAAEIPVRQSGTTGTTGAGSKITAKNGAEARAAAARSAGVQPFFYLAAPPATVEAPRKVLPFTAPHSQSAQRYPGQQQLIRTYLDRLLYTSAASAREQSFYRNLLQAAERELHIFTARGYHAELL